MKKVKFLLVVVLPILVLASITSFSLFSVGSNQIMHLTSSPSIEVANFTQTTVILYPNGTTVHQSFHGTEVFAYTNGIWMETSVNGMPVNFSLVSPDFTSATKGSSVDPDILGQVTTTGLSANTFYQATVCYVSGCSSQFSAIPIVIGTGIFNNGYTGHIQYPGSSPSVPVSKSAFSWFQETNSKGDFFLNWRACC